MAKCNQLTPLSFKWLKRYSDGDKLSLSLTCWWVEYSLHKIQFSSSFTLLSSLCQLHGHHCVTQWGIIICWRL